MPKSAIVVKVCSSCREPKDRDQDFAKNRRARDGRQNECKSCQHDRNIQPARAAMLLESSARYRAANQDLVRERQRSRPRNKTAESARQARYIARLKTKVFAHYGTACACCGTSEDLSLDHVNGDGGEHRSELFGRGNGSTRMFLWIIKNGFPEGFQTLCRSCNSSKAKTGRCRLLHGIDCPSCGHYLTRAEILAAAAFVLS